MASTYIVYIANTTYLHFLLAETAAVSEESEQALVTLRSLDEIEAEFAIVTTQIKNVLQENDISVVVLIERLCATSAVSHKKVPIFDDDISDKVKSVDELWQKLKGFWNILDYDILILVIKLADCSEAQKILDNFLEKIDFSALKDDDLILHYKIFEEKLARPVLRVKVNAARCTVYIKQKVKVLISDTFDVKKYSLRLKGIKEGCVEFIFYVSKAVMSYLLEFKVTGSIMANLVANYIVSLQINDNLKLDMPTEISDVVSKKAVVPEVQNYNCTYMDISTVYSSIYGSNLLLALFSELYIEIKMLFQHQW